MATNDKNNGNLDQDPASRVNERNADRDPSYNKNTDKHRDPDSKTFSEDEESYENNNTEDKSTFNSGTTGNDWDANNPVERSDRYRYDEEERNAADYISSDHSNYNRSDSRFYWNSYDF